jgi:hypothetical protein
VFVTDLEEITPHTKCVGWLSGTQPYSQGETSEDFQSALAEHVATAWQNAYAMGVHQCELCSDLPGAKKVCDSLNLYIPTDDCLYYAPSMILHYVLDHKYRPPDEFIAAVLASPPQKSEKFQRLILKFYPSEFADCLQF